jgi:hypothetical protein
MKNAGGRTMISTEVVDVFLKRRIQPMMSRAHQMWSYYGSKDVTRINAAELSEKEILDEVRRLTHFIQEDSIPLVTLQDPYELHHPRPRLSYYLGIRYSIQCMHLIALF